MSGVMDDRIRMGMLMQNARDSVRMSRDAVAAHGNFSAITLRNWEHGYSMPDVVEFFDLFKILRTSPQKTIDAYRFPSMNGLSGRSSDAEISAAFWEMMRETQMRQRRQLLLMRSTYCGGEWTPVLEMINAHLQTPLAARFAVAELISANYHLSEAHNAISQPLNVRPDMALLDRAIGLGREAAMAGFSGYSLK